MEKIKAIILIIIVLILTAVSAHSQRAINGKVIEILDGRTCVIEVTNTKIIAVLEFIETPEPEQPLHNAIKDHLAKLLLNQKVDFYPRLINRDRTVGQILLDGRDISQQMLRDGAAWLAVKDKASIPPEGREMYSNNEAQAKLEKRGVWGVENLKPAWEFRAEKENQRLEEERRRWQQSLRAASAGASVKRSGQTSQPVDTRASAYWFDVSGVADAEKPTYGGLLTGYDAMKRIGYVSTQSFFSELSDRDFLRRLESRVFYIYRGDKQQIDDAVYVIAFLSVSKKQKFADSNSLLVNADGQKINLGKAKRFQYNSDEFVKELLVFKATRAQLTKIAEAKSVGFNLGPHTGQIDADTRDYLNNLLNSSN